MPNLAAPSRAAVLAAIVSLVLGCDGETPRFDPATNYTVETLAQDLISHFERLDSQAKEAPAKTPAAVAKETTKGAKIREMDAAKEAGAPTLDALIDDVSRKAILVKDVPREEVLKRVAAIVVAHQSLKAADKKLLADRLQNVE